MAQDAELELRIDSRDEAVVQDVERQLSSITVTRWEAARMDSVTTLVAVAAAAKLVSALLDLKARLARKSDQPKITVTSADGTTIAIADATEEMLTALVAGFGSKK